MNSDLCVKVLGVLAQQGNPMLHAPADIRFVQGAHIDQRRRIDASLVDEQLKSTQIQLVHWCLQALSVEAVLWQLPVQRSLPALESYPD